MKLSILLVTIVLTVLTATAQDGAQDWMSGYYQSPSPERFVTAVQVMIDEGALGDPNSQPPVVAFLSTVMRDNPDMIADWMKAFDGADEATKSALRSSAWFSDTDAARGYFES